MREGDTVARLGGHEFHSMPSIGITLFGPRACSALDLLKEANHAMYQAKTAGHNTLRFFSEPEQLPV